MKVECKLTSINLGRESELQMTFWADYEVTLISDDQSENTVGVAVISLEACQSVRKAHRSPGEVCWSTGENFGNTSDCHRLN